MTEAVIKEPSYEEATAEKECEECGNTAPKRQVDAYDGECGRCHFENEPEENKTYYRKHEDIDIHEHRSSDRKQDKDENLTDEWRKKTTKV